MKYLLRLVAVMAMVTVFSACKKEQNELGSQLVVLDDLEVLSFDDQEIRVSVVKEDPLKSLKTPTSFVGSINDPDFGKTNASLYTEFRMPSTDVEFGATAVADSLILTLEIAGYYGDTLSAVHFRVMEMLEQIETTSEVYSSDDFDYDSQELGDLEFSQKPIIDSVITLKLSNDFAQQFLDADVSNFADNDAFQSFFYGLYIACDDVADNGLLLEFDLISEKSKLTLYYHTEDADSLFYDFQINSNADRTSHWAHNYSATEIENSFGLENVNKAYVQGGAGLRTYLDFPELAGLQDSNYVIHKAELTIPYITTDLDGIYASPEKLGLAALNNEGDLEFLVEDQNEQGSDYFDGNRNELTETYKFNIARYVHKVVEEGYGSRLVLYVPSSVSHPERVMINNGFANDNTSISLKLFVSQQ